MISKRLFLGLIASAPALMVPAAKATAKPTLEAQYFAACVKSGLMTPNEARAQRNRRGGPDWPSLPVSVRL